MTPGTGVGSAGHEETESPGRVEAEPPERAAADPSGRGPRVGVVVRPQLPPRSLREVAIRADAVGLDDVWLWEDCFLEGGLTSATAVLAATERVRVGLGLMPVPLRNPALAAMEIATVAHLFPGRFAPAVGHGVQAWMAQVGARPESPMTLLREWTSAVRDLLAGETVDVHGRYVALDNVALDWPPPDVPPVLIGARGPRTLALAGELAQGTVLDSDNTPAGVRAAAEHVSPPPGHEIVVYVLAGRDEQARRRHLEGTAGHRPEAIVVGESGPLAEHLHEYAEAGADTIALVAAAGEPDLESFLDLAAEARERLAGR